jgi:four helix bundle protein
MTENFDKMENRNSNIEISNSKGVIENFNDLENRSMRFSLAVRDFCRTVKHDTINLVYIKQVIRSSSSTGANYIEANEKLGKQDLLMRLKLSRKEAKETRYWLEHFSVENAEALNKLKQEAEELRRIFSAIINKVSTNNN